MSEHEEFQQAQKKVIRRQILAILHIAGLVGANEKTISLALQSQGIPLLPAELRNHLDYLEQRKVLGILDREKSVWAAKITPDGTDIMDGTAKTPDWMAKI